MTDAKPVSCGTLKILWTARPAAVAVDQDRLLAGLGDRHRQVGRQRRFAVGHVRAGHLDDLMADPVRVEVEAVRTLRYASELTEFEA